jgi:hypothetical protein
VWRARTAKTEASKPHASLSSPHILTAHQKYPIEVALLLEIPSAASRGEFNPGD